MGCYVFQYKTHYHKSFTSEMWQFLSYNSQYCSNTQSENILGNSQLHSIAFPSRAIIHKGNSINNINIRFIHNRNIVIQMSSNSQGQDKYNQETVICITSNINIIIGLRSFSIIPQELNLNANLGLLYVKGLIDCFGVLCRFQQFFSFIVAAGYLTRFLGV